MIIRLSIIKLIFMQKIMLSYINLLNFIKTLSLFYANKDHLLVDI